MSPDFDAIRRGLDQLRAAPIQEDDPGGKSHRYVLNPPLTEEEVRAFEAVHRVALPADYRAFLIQLGNGGAGPVYGVFKLGEMDDGWGHSRWAENDGFVGTLAAPFPHTGAWNDRPEEPDSDAAAEAGSDGLGESEARYYDPANVNGAIPICHEGCAFRDWLVVTGPEAGHIWCDARADYDGLYPLQWAGAGRVSFIEWYRSWLGGRLRRLAERAE